MLFSVIGAGDGLNTEFIKFEKLVTDTDNGGFAGAVLFTFAPCCGK